MVSFVKPTDTAPTTGLIPTVANSADWLSQRQSLIGASDIGTIFGVNEYVTRYRLWEVKTNKVEPSRATFRMNAGHYFEEGIAQMAFNHIPEMISMQPDEGIRIHDTQPYLAASLDRWGRIAVRYLDKGVTDTTEVYVLDCKCMGINQYRKMKDAWLPLKAYWLQIQQQILVSEHSLNTKIGYLACWLGNQMLRVYQIAPCKATQEQILQAAERFYNCMTSDKPPGIDNNDFVDESYYRHIENYMEMSTTLIVVQE